MSIFSRSFLYVAFFLVLWSKDTNAQQFNLQGSASQTGAFTYTITPNINTQTGMITNIYPLDLLQNFTLNFEMNFGANDANGADGMAFLMSNVCNPVLTSGEGLGVSGILNSLIAEFDTWDNGTPRNDIPDDHTGIYADGMINSGGNIMDAATLPVCMLSNCRNVEDGQWYSIAIQWEYIDAVTQRLSVFFNGTLRTTSTRNHILQRFNNNNIVFWSIAGSTGGSANFQQFRLLNGNNNLSFCEGENFVLTAPSLGTNYDWTGSPSTTNSASYTAVTSGTITCNYTDFCNISRTANFIITVNQKPVVTVNGPSVCDVSTMVTATIVAPGSYNYVWTVPAGVPDPGNVAGFVTTVAGNYAVIATNTTTGCISNIASGVVTFLIKPTVSLNTPAPICEGQQAIFTAMPGTPGSYGYAWIVPTGATNPGNIASFLATIAGTYSMIITNTANGCSSNAATADLVVNLLPVVSLNSPQVCTGVAAPLAATPANAGSYNYIWTVPTGVTNPGNVANFSTTAGGNYSVQINDNITGCIGNTATGTVTIFSIPVVSVNSATICEGSTVPILATISSPGTYMYNWTVPTGVNNPGNVAMFNAGIAGNYAVIVQDVATGCNSNSSSGNINVNPGLEPQFTAVSPGCNGSLIMPLPTTSINDINGLWLPAINNTRTTFYIFTPSPGVCADTASMQIIIINPPQFNLGPDQEICPGQQIGLNPNSTGTGLQYIWQDGTTSPVYSAIIPGNYSVTISNQCGNANDVIQIKQGVCKVFVPTGFTPNNDGLNDRFTITGPSYVKDFYMQVYNRWGQKIYATKDPYNGWDGKLYKIEQPAGVYIYRIGYTYLLTGLSNTENGTLMLIR